jgi:predicted RNA-binding Zn ribbon-like protein
LFTYTSKTTFAGTLYRQSGFCRYHERVYSVAKLPFIAGDVALDFVNTAEERGHPSAGDALHTIDDLRLWGQRRGVLTSGAGGGSNGDEQAGELPDALAARELLYQLFLDRIHGRRSSDSDLTSLSSLASMAYQAARMDQEPNGRLTRVWDPTRLATVRHVAVTAAVELLGQDPTTRLKQCPGDHCGWFFLDGTKRGNRRWCSMSDCGQEAKAASRRERSTPPAALTDRH